MMSVLTPAGANKIVSAKNTHEKELKLLISQSFDLSNINHLVSLKEYIDDFEFTLNKMYFLQGIRTGLMMWLSIVAARLFLPIPDFANYFLSAILYIGPIGNFLYHSNINGYLEQLQEMKEIYTWVLKEKNATNITTRLNNPDIQRLVKLMAPLCEPEFIKVWPQNYTLMNFFSSEPSQALKVLQEQVETGALKVNAYQGLQQAIEYFTTNPHSRKWMIGTVQASCMQVKEVVSETITSSFALKKS